ncbi:TFIIB-type zinc ribbon-containing protein [Megalodesulfovibrio paquesii]
MPDVIAPARVEFVLVYACPSCGKDALLRAKETGQPTACRHCQTVFTPQALADEARDGMLRIFSRLQPPAPRAVKVSGMRGLCFTLFGSLDLSQFASVAEVDLLHSKLTASASARQVGELIGQTILIHGTVRESGTPGQFTFGIIEGTSKRTEAFLEFPAQEQALEQLQHAGVICVQGTCNGLMGSHNPLAIWCSDCRVVGVQGRQLPPGREVPGVIFDLLPNSPRNPLDAHLIFQAPQPGDVQAKN